MPASRRARAMTLAPRSWPSNPGFAMTTRIFCIVVVAASRRLPASGWQPVAESWSLYQRYLFVLTPDFAQRVAHLSHRGVGTDAVHQRVHRIPGAARRLLEQVEGPPHLVGVAGLAQLREP